MTETEWLSPTDPEAMLEYLRGPLMRHRSDPMAAREEDRFREEYRESHPSLTNCKLRLFACACCRQVWHLLTDERSRRAVEVAERYADGEITAIESNKAADNTEHAGMMPIERMALWAAHTGSSTGVQIAIQEFMVNARNGGPPQIIQAALLRDIFGNPFRPVMLPLMCPRRCSAGFLLYGDCAACGRYGECPWLTWNDRTVPRLAQQIYDSREFDRMSILADALEEAGCTDQEILMHCRSVAPRQCPRCKSEGRIERQKDAYMICPTCDGCKVIWDREPNMMHVRGCWVIDLILGKV